MQLMNVIQSNHKTNENIIQSTTVHIGRPGVAVHQFVCTNTCARVRSFIALSSWIKWDILI